MEVEDNVPNDDAVGRRTGSAGPQTLDPQVFTDDWAILPGRLGCVLETFKFFERQEQIVLADAALIYLFALLAEHPKQAIALDNLFAMTDVLFGSGIDASQKWSHPEQNQFLALSNRRREFAFAYIQDILEESGAKIAQKPKTLAYLLGNVIHNLRQRYLAFVPMDHLIHVITATNSFSLSLAAIGNSSTIAINPSLLAKYQVIHAALNEAMQSVHDAIECGLLHVVDGRIVSHAE